MGSPDDDHAMTLTLTATELGLLIEALDSHAYWQLSDPRYRNNGFVFPPGSDDAEAQAELAQAEALAARLEAVRQR